MALPEFRGFRFLENADPLMRCGLIMAGYNDWSARARKETFPSMRRTMSENA